MVKFLKKLNNETCVLHCLDQEDEHLLICETKELFIVDDEEDEIILEIDKISEGDEVCYPYKIIDSFSTKEFIEYRILLNEIKL